MRTLKVTLLVLAVLTVQAFAETIKVGPSEANTTISAVASTLKPGDVVEVTGDIVDSMRLSASGAKDNPIIIRGVGDRRPKIDFNKARNGIETRGDYYLLENLELTNASSRGIFHVSHGITVRNCYFHDNNNGIMGADDPNTGDITIEYCEFFRNGGGIYAHQMYLASWKPGATAIVQFNYIHDSSGGVNIKSRMPHNIIRYNWIENAANYECDIVDSDQAPMAATLRPMNTEFIGNVVITNAQGGNPHHKMNFGSDQPRSPGTEGTFTIANNTFVLRRSSDEIHMFRIGGKVKEAFFYNNVFVAPDVPSFRVVVIEDTAAEPGEPGSAGRLGKLVGSGNFIASGCLDVPAQFAGTVRADSAGFADLKAFDFSLAPGSPCVGAGDKSASMAAHFSPVRAKVDAGKGAKRPAGDKMDIGAFGMTIAALPDTPPAE